MKWVMKMSIDEGDWRRRKKVNEDFRFWQWSMEGERGGMTLGFISGREKEREEEKVKGEEACAARVID